MNLAETCRAILEHLPSQCFTAVDLSMRYTYAAGPLLLVFELTPEGIIGLHPDDIAPGITPHYVMALAGHDVTVIDREFRGHHLEQIIFPLYGAGGIVGAASAIRDVTHRVNNLRLQEQLATTDALTGLANLRAFTARAAKGLRACTSLLVIDVDRFKAINDTRGHAGGDLVLCAIADTLVRCTRPQDMVARTGGDEFSILLADAEQTEAFSVAMRIRLTVSRMLGDVSVSVGVATFPHDGATVTDLRTVADRRMYEAKRGER